MNFIYLYICDVYFCATIFFFSFCFGSHSKSRYKWMWCRRKEIEKWYRKITSTSVKTLYVYIYEEIYVCIVYIRIHAEFYMYILWYYIHTHKRIYICCIYTRSSLVQYPTNQPTRKKNKFFVLRSKCNDMNMTHWEE